MSESPALEVKDLGHRYSGAACPTLEEVTFSLQPGRIGCLLGPSGSGKTTLLRMIAGFEPVHAGMIRVAGGCSWLIEVHSALPTGSSRWWTSSTWSWTQRGSPSSA